MNFAGSVAVGAGVYRTSPLAARSHPLFEIESAEVVRESRDFARVAHPANKRRDLSPPPGFPREIRSFVRSIDRISDDRTSAPRTGGFRAISHPFLSIYLSIYFSSPLLILSVCPPWTEPTENCDSDVRHNIR